VPLDYLIEEFEKIVVFKGKHNIEAHIDTVGDPIVYPKLVELVASLRQVEGVETVSMQTHGSVLSEKLLDKLSDAGLTRINLSLDALEPDLAKRIADTEWYDVEKVCTSAQYIVSNTNVELLLSPVWVPTQNDAEMPKIIRLARKLKIGKRFPPLGIQKYEIHKHGRKVKNVKPMRWQEFYKQLQEWESKFKIKLVLGYRDFGIHRRLMLPVPYKKNSKQ